MLSNSTRGRTWPAHPMARRLRPAAAHLTRDVPSSLLVAGADRAPELNRELRVAFPAVVRTDNNVGHALARGNPHTAAPAFALTWAEFAAARGGIHGRTVMAPLLACPGDTTLTIL